MRCCIKLCQKHRNKQNDQKISFHLFPKDEHIKKKWLDIIGPSNIDRSSDFVCSAHFHSSDFDYAGNKRVLSHSALPYIDEHLVPQDKEPQDDHHPEQPTICELTIERISYDQIESEISELENNNNQMLSKTLHSTKDSSSPTPSLQSIESIECCNSMFVKGGGGISLKRAMVPSSDEEDDSILSPNTELKLKSKINRLKQYSTKNKRQIKTLVQKLQRMCKRIALLNEEIVNLRKLTSTES